MGYNRLTLGSIVSHQGHHRHNWGPHVQHQSFLGAKYFSLGVTLGHMEEVSVQGTGSVPSSMKECHKGRDLWLGVAKPCHGIVPALKYCQREILL